MDAKERIANSFFDNMADVFLLDREYLQSNPELKFKEDLAAKSMQFFPLLAAMEEEFDIEIGLRDFQYECRTLAEAIDYIVKIFNKSN